MIHWLAHKLGLKSCPACETLVDYAMDGLESPQQEKVRQHLSDCPSCMEQVRDFMQVKEGLGLCAPESDVPGDFSAKVLGRIQHADPACVREPLNKGNAQRHLGGWPRFWMTVGPVFAVLSITMTMVALGALLGHKGSAIASAPAPQNELASIGNALMSDPQAAHVQLVSAEAGKASSGSLVLCPGKSEAFFKASNLSKCPLGRHYALWMKRGDAKPERLARFSVEADGSSVHLLNLGTSWDGSKPADFMVTQESGADAGQTWMKGSLRL
jgi:hypothetical protein